MRLSVEVEHRLGEFALQAAFDAPSGVTALFGRSGSGKTTLVNVIGGLLRPGRGRVVVDGVVLLDTDDGTEIPCHRRRIGYVFQEARLFPHLTVRQNLLFGRFFAPRRERGPDLPGVVDLLGIGHLLARRPAGLSGGERQRVAIGRALLSKPRLLLMDEPLASLDAARKAEILPYLERLRDEAAVPIVYVSHAMAEVARLADTLVLLEAGRVIAAGPASDLVSRLDVARAEGDEASAVLEAEVIGHDAELGVTVLSSRAGELRIPSLNLPAGARSRVRIYARDVLLAVDPPGRISAMNVLPGTVSTIEELPDGSMMLQLDCGDARLLSRITRGSLRALGLRPGSPAYAVVKAAALADRLPAI
ncbi:molybdenum ABC transporter ATP-binding protein [Enterovirga aerilata]|uniref:Molybdenum ABC transporter ATP-binding protein n=1 Tax=Enterovirga aerilata TaxID=2730920 RepID=A0A849I1R6_9HYPH|nr:molybdenum ABC transporter ATP-binding protein [Enterovirga sp. DB1703]NNM71288.1 molybdenum ABC transporter ATP-binding protein [Enterovirga sp. DB1703]